MIRLDDRWEIHDMVEAIVATLPPALRRIPRPVVAIANACGFEVHPIAGVSPGFQGIYVGVRPWILVRAADPVHVQRLTIIHELAHGWGLKLEWEVNAFAEALLMPRDAVAAIVRAWAPAPPWTVAEWARQERARRRLTQLARRFGVGRHAMFSALANYGWVTGVAPGTARLAGDALFEQYLHVWRATP
ncbi:MAG: hypothetical protein OWV35_02445 [Firmicutes bacterium]|nr:hypothetical protein [Bacillota bacterium]